MKLLVLMNRSLVPFAISTIETDRFVALVTAIPFPFNLFFNLE